MATKKQKRAAAEAKHERMMEELRRSGLAAQQKDREIREAKLARAKDDAAKRNNKADSKAELIEILRDMAGEGIE